MRFDIKPRLDFWCGFKKHTFVLSVLCSSFGDCVSFSTVVGCLQEMIDVPLYVSLHSMSATLKCTPPSATLFRSAVVNAGYHISGSHANPLGLKTDAPMEVLWDIMRCWVCCQNLLHYVPICMLVVYVGGLCISCSFGSVHQF